VSSRLRRTLVSSEIACHGDTARAVTPACVHVHSLPDERIALDVPR
jgi:hypothetical protein